MCVCVCFLYTDDRSCVSNLEKEESEIEVLATCEVSFAATTGSYSNMFASDNRTQLSACGDHVDVDQNTGNNLTDRAGRYHIQNINELDTKVEVSSATKTDIEADNSRNKTIANSRTDSTGQCHIESVHEIDTKAEVSPAKKTVGDDLVPLNSAVEFSPTKTESSNYLSDGTHQGSSADDYIVVENDRNLCTVCGKRLHPRSMKQHLRTHSGATPYRFAVLLSTKIPEYLYTIQILRIWTAFSDYTGLTLLSSFSF